MILHIIRLLDTIRSTLLGSSSLKVLPLAVAEVILHHLVHASSNSLLRALKTNSRIKVLVLESPQAISLVGKGASGARLLQC